MPQVDIPIPIIGGRRAWPDYRSLHPSPHDAADPVRVLESAGGFTRLEEAALRIYCADVAAGHIDLSAKAVVELAKSLLAACTPGNERQSPRLDP